MPDRDLPTAPPPTTRRLAAILVADVVGSSRLMGADEDATLAALRRLFAELAEPAVAEHGGRIFKSMGDGFLAEFPSAVGAVLCAEAMQRGMAGHAPLQLRVGVHLGDVVPQGEDLLGDGVNIAARLEGEAEPGGVAVSAAVAEAVRGKLPFELRDAGLRELKNIDHKVRVFEIAEAKPAERLGIALPVLTRKRWRRIIILAVLAAVALSRAFGWNWPWED